MNRDVSLREMLEAMSHLPDSDTFRWYQISLPGPGWASAGDTLRVTLGQARSELGMESVPSPG